MAKNIQEIKIFGEINDGLIQPLLSQVANSDADAFLLRINSEGGDVTQMFQLISELKNTGKPYYAINEGFAISCGAVLLASADKSYSYPYGVSLIHNPFYSDTDEVDEFLTKVKDSLMSILSNKIHSDNLSELLSQETTWNAMEAKQYGLVDEIIGETIIPISNYKKEIIASFIDNKKIFNLMNTELENKINSELEEKTNAETVTETVEEKQVPQETVEEVKDECGQGKEEDVKNETNVEEEVKTNEEVKNEEDESKIAELERLLTEKDAYIAELESKLEEATGKKEEVINKETINKMSQEAIESVKHLFESEAIVNDDSKLAEKIFSINGDETLRINIKNKQPELYNRLLEKYYSK